MKSYRFKLQTVLDYRSKQLDQVLQRVALVEQERVRIANRLDEYDQVITQAFAQQQHTEQSGTLNLMQRQTFPDYIWRLKQQRFQTLQDLQHIDQRLQHMRHELHQALIKKKALETLKDKDHARYRQQLEKAEEEFLAELALNRAARRIQTA